MQLRCHRFCKITFLLIFIFFGLIWINSTYQNNNVIEQRFPRVEKEQQKSYDSIVNFVNNQSLKLADIQEWKFGNYCVWFDFTKATELPDENSVTLCTHGTIGYSKFIFDHVSLSVS